MKNELKNEAGRQPANHCNSSDSPLSPCDIWNQWITSVKNIHKDRFLLNFFVYTVALMQKHSGNILQIFLLF